MAETIKLKENQTVKGEDVSVETKAQLFPEYTQGTFKVSEDKKEKLFEEAKEESKDSNFFVKFFDVLPLPGQEFISGTTENLYVKKVGEAEKEALTNKTDFISKVVGSPVENIGLENLKDQALAFSLSRYKFFKNRKKTFLDYYPEGVYERLPINFGDEEPEKLEIFKYNKNDETFRIVNPYGRDFAEVGRVAGAVIDEQLAGEMIALGTSRIPGWGQLPPTVRVMIGNYLGIKGKELNKFLMGKGEEEYANIESIKELDVSKVFTGSDDYINSLLAGGLFKITKEIGGFFFGGSKPGTINLAPDMVEAAEKLNLEPLVFAQLVANPLIRRIYTQTGEFVGDPDSIVNKQISSLEEALKKFGIGDGTGQLDRGQLQSLNEALALKVADDIKFFDSKGFNFDDANAALLDSINRFNIVSRQTRANKTSTLINSVGDETANINIYGVKQVFGKQINQFIEKFQPKDIKVKVDGETVFKTPKKSIYGYIPEELKYAYQTLQKMDVTISSVNKGKNKGLDNLRTLIKVREDLHKVMNTSKDPDVVAAASKMHESIVKVMKPNNKGEYTFVQGNEDFLINMKILNSHMEGAENIKSLAFFHQALGKGGDIDTLVQQFIRPDGSLKLVQIENLLKSGVGNETQQKAAEETFEIMKKAWFNSVIKSDDGIKILDEFLAKDPASLKILLGDGYLPKVDKIKEIVSNQNQLVDGIVAQAMKGNQKELYQTIQNLSKKTTLGTEKKVEDIIIQLGGVNSNAAGVIRYEIINDIINKSRILNTRKGKEFLTDTLDTRKLRVEINNLLKNDNLMKFFQHPDNVYVDALKNFQLYSTALTGASDTGNSIVAGGKAADFINSFDVLNLGFTLLKNKIVSRLLSSEVHAGLFNELALDSPTSIRNLNLISDAISSLAKDKIDVSLDENKAKDTGILYQHKTAVPDRDIKVVPPEIDNIPTPNNLDLAKSQINAAPPIDVSRLGQANIAQPVNNLAAADPSVMDRGKQLFNRPNEITFASKGGIMNARKVMQRVI